MLLTTVASIIIGSVELSQRCSVSHIYLYDNWVSWVESKIFCITQMRLNWTRLNTKSKPMSHLSLTPF